MNFESKSKRSEKLYSNILTERGCGRGHRKCERPFVKKELGADYMASFSPAWNFSPPTGLRLCCDCMTSFSPGWNLKLLGKWETATLFRSKHNHWACLSSLFSPGWNFNAITWGFSEFNTELKVSPCNSKHLSLRWIVQEAKLKSQSG